jgi:hypothetical protein
MHDPMSQKPFMWNSNNRIEWSDPSGYVPEEGQEDDPATESPTYAEQARATGSQLTSENASLQTLRTIIQNPNASPDARACAQAAVALQGSSIRIAGSRQISDKSGGGQQAEGDFNEMRLTDVTTKSGGTITGKMANGVTVNLHLSTQEIRLRLLRYRSRRRQT